MPVIQSSDIGDLLRTSLNRLNKAKFTEIATDRQQSIFTTKMMRQRKISFKGGPLFQWEVMFQHNSSARAIGLYEVDNVNAVDVIMQAVAPLRQYEASYPIDHHEVTRNSGESKILDILKVRRFSALISLRERLEIDAWRLPAATDLKSMWGFPYWIVKNNTEGFNGGTPSGYSDVAGINTTTYPRWRNWTFQYTSVTKDDLIRKWRKAANYIDWMPAVEGISDFDTGESCEWYTNYAVLGTLAEILESQNDQLGSDLSPMDGKVMFQRSKVNWVVELDQDTTNPVYGIPWGVFKLATETDWFMKESIVERAAKQHNVTEYHIDLTIQPHCYDRRKAMVGATNTGLPA